MASSENRHTVNISLFGFLRYYMDEQGLPYALEREIAREGEAAFDIAIRLSVPPEKIEAVFCNGRVINIYDPVFPGDRLAFFPFGTPGPWPFSPLELLGRTVFFWELCGKIGNETSGRKRLLIWEKGNEFRDTNKYP